jgi:predicted dehydrogenase/threonine dehydrogenase-like Zn-dependent dehydrogenase
MKQVLQNLRSGETSVAEIPIPTPKPGTALVRTAASLVSAGTERMLVEFAEKSLVGKARSRPDLVRQVLDKARREGLLTTVEAAFNRLDQPMPLGYSSAGTIVDQGEGLEGFRVGQRVACAGGGYAVHAEYGVIPQNLLAELPEEVDFESAAFATLGAIAMHGFRLSGAQIGERVAIIGLGLLGLLAVGIAGAAGCQVLGIDLNLRRVQLAKDFGAESVLRDQAESAAQSFTQGRGCDVILICADTPSADPVELAGEIARDRARVVATGAVGLQLPRKIYYEKELLLINSRSYGPGRYDPAYEEEGQDYPIGYVRWTEGRNLEAFVDLLASGRLDVHPLITHRFPIEQAPQAYELITGKRQEPFLGVLLTYPEIAEGETSETKHVIRNAEYVMHNSDYAARSTHHVSRVSLGVLGAGNFASAVMLPAFQRVENVELVGVVSAAGLSAKNAADRFNFHYATSDEHEILNDPAINTIAILTRHHLHANQVIASLRAGKHVFCEKPLAIKREELGEILKVLQDIHPLGNQVITDTDHPFHDRPGDALLTEPYPLLMVGFNRRFAPLAQKMRAFLGDRQEPLVAHYRVNAGFLPLTHWLHDPEQGGGRIIGEGCHFIDFLTFLVGTPPVSVTARALADQGRYREDNVILTFAFADGSLGTVSYLANGDKSFPKERIEVFCGGRVAVLDDFRSLEIIQDGQRKIHRSRLRQDKGHRAEWEAFARAILEGGAPPISYDHLFGVAQATFAAVEATRSGEKTKIC